jgi:hypothetical protein
MKIPHPTGGNQSVLSFSFLLVQQIAKGELLMVESRIKDPGLASQIDEEELEWYKNITPITEHYSRKIAFMLGMVSGLCSARSS